MLNAADKILTPTDGGSSLVVKGPAVPDGEITVAPDSGFAPVECLGSGALECDGRTRRFWGQNFGSCIIPYLTSILAFYFCSTRWQAR